MWEKEGGAPAQSERDLLRLFQSLDRDKNGRLEVKEVQVRQHGAGSGHKPPVTERFRVDALGTGVAPGERA